MPWVASFFWLLPAFIRSSEAGKEGSALPQLSVLLPLVLRGGKAQGSGTNSKRGSGPKAVCLKGPYPALAWGKGWV